MSSVVSSVPLSRRGFLVRSAGVAALATWSGRRGGLRAAPGAGPEPMTRAWPMPPEMEPLHYRSVTDLAARLRTRELSAWEVVEACIARQLEIDDRINAVVMTCYQRAREEARRLDAAAARGEFAGPLHGVPMTIKDSFDTEGVISTGGTYGRQQYVPEHDAVAVARLRAAGAILLGKTNTPEFTLGGVGDINTTGNMLYGSSHNPYDLTLTTSGSSGGAGANVAAGGAAFDFGSDIGGSLRLPAHVNGVCGLKTTMGRVPRTGHIVPFGGVFDSWQQLGPLARRVADLEVLGAVTAGPDARDAACVPIAWADPAKVDLAGLRVAFFPHNGLSVIDEEVQATVRQAAAWLSELADDVTEDCPTEAFGQLHEARGRMSMGDGWSWYKRLAEKWGTHHLSPGMSELVEQAKPIPAAEFVRWWEQEDAAKSKLLTWMQRYDVLLCPVAGSAATPIDWDPALLGNMRGILSDVGVFNSTGWPVVVVPCGKTADGRLPIGVQVVAQPWREDVALAVARYLESRSGGWTPPSI